MEELIEYFITKITDSSSPVMDFNWTIATLQQTAKTAFIEGLKLDQLMMCIWFAAVAVSFC